MRGCAFEIGHVEYDVARAHEIERRFEDVFADGQRLCSESCIGAAHRRGCHVLVR